MAQEVINNKELAIIIVHNNNKLRNNHILPKAKELAERLNAEMAEIHVQPEIKPLPIIKAVIRDIKQKILVNEWKKYCQNKHSNILIVYVQNIIKTILKYIFKKNMENRIKSSIEIIVTNKHRKAWVDFATKYKITLILEDDAVFTEDSISKMTEILNTLKNEESSTPIFYDVAGGLAHESLQIEKLINKKSNNEIEYIKPVTNTACGYIINNKFARLAISFSKHLQDDQPLAIDWYLNSLFIECDKHKIYVYCTHRVPTIVNHGSFNNSYSSWQKEKLPK